MKFVMAILCFFGAVFFGGEAIALSPDVEGLVIPCAGFSYSTGVLLALGVK